MRLFAGNANVQVVLLFRVDGHPLLVHLRADLFRGVRDAGRAAAQGQQGRLPAVRDAAGPQRQRVQPAGPPEGVFPARFRPLPHENAGQGMKFPRQKMSMEKIIMPFVCGYIINLNYHGAPPISLLKLHTALFPRLYGYRFVGSRIILHTNIAAAFVQLLKY